MRVLLLGAGGPAANGFARCLRLAGGYHIIGANQNADDLLLAECDEAHLDEGLLALVEKTRPDIVHSQPDEPVLEISQHRHAIRSLGARVYLPRHDVIERCQDKWLTYLALEKCGVPVPDTRLPGHWPEFSGKMLHLRPRIGSGGKGSVSGPYSLISAHLPAVEAWGNYTLAEWLPGPTVIYQALYERGTLIAGQLRARQAWTNIDRGSCRIGITVSDPAALRVAEAAIRAVDMLPHGVYGIDMIYDAAEKPRVTEINIGRFFTTIEFFARAGVNFPDLYCRTAMGEKVEHPGKQPLPDGLRWIRQMDREPLLVS